MIIKVISSDSDTTFNDSLQSIIKDMDQQGYMLVNIDYKPVSMHEYICFTALLTFANPREEQSKMSSTLNIVSNGMEDFPFLR